jgi:hypothetical protein
MISAVPLLVIIAGCGRSVRDEVGSTRVGLATDSDGARYFEVTGLEGLPGTGQPTWRESVRIYTLFERDASPDGLPPLAGSYVFTGGVLRFKPRFPLEPGLEYSARVYGSSGRFRETRFRIPKREVEPTTRVSAVYPSAALLPANLLKFYIHFSAPMSVGRSYEHIRLLDSKGEAVKYPFLELDEELWDPTGRRLTVFIDPGRIKQGVLPNSEVGPVFVTGQDYTLEISPGWKDASGASLRSPFTKSFRVSGADHETPDPAAWKMSVPSGGGRDPLSLDFAAPLDHALLHRLLWVEAENGSKVAGEVSVQEGERRWLLQPQRPWSPGRYRLMIRSTLEDLAGNGIDKPFEVDLFEQVRSRVDSKILSREFTVSPPPR